MAAFIQCVEMSAARFNIHVHVHVGHVAGFSHGTVLFAQKAITFPITYMYVSLHSAVAGSEKAS